MRVSDWLVRRDWVCPTGDPHLQRVHAAAPTDHRWQSPGHLWPGARAVPARYYRGQRGGREAGGQVLWPGTVSITQYFSILTHIRLLDLGQKLVRLVQFEINPGLFQIRFQYILARGAKMYCNLIWKSPGFVQFEANMNLFSHKSDIPDSRIARLVQKYVKIR